MRFIVFTYKRIISLVPTLLGIVVILFFVAHIIPADPAGLIAGPAADQKQIEEIRHIYGFDRPVYEQLWVYLSKLMKGDLGESLYTRRSVMWEIGKRFPATLELALVALVFSIVSGISMGIYTAFNRNKWSDHLARVFTIAGVAVAAFWMGIMLQLVFGYLLDLLPVGGRISGNAPIKITGLYLLDSVLTFNWKAFIDSLMHMVLPIMSLSFGPFATITRFTRAGILRTLNSDFVQYEKSMGVSRFTYYKYILRNSLTATVSQIGLLFGFLLGGSVVVERVYSWPGLGSFAVESILLMDYMAVLGIALWSGIAYTIGNLFVDVVLVMMDPREATK